MMDFEDWLRYFRKAKTPHTLAVMAQRKGDKHPEQQGAIEQARQRRADEIATGVLL